MDVKLQVALGDSPACRTRAVAKREKVPKDQLVREGIELRAHVDRQQANQAFFDAITGIFDSPETDLSTRVDEILYGGK